MVSLRILALLALAFGGVLVPSLQARAAVDSGVERIVRFSSSIKVNADSSIEVTEDVTAYFPEPRHGIDREIPVHYRDTNGFKQNVKLTVRSVEDGEGKPLEYSVSGMGDDLRIRIGDPDRTVTGENRYVIDYTVRRALLFFSDHDELYWNVSGDAWRLPLEKVTATVELPEGASAGEITTSCYTGPRGSTAKDCGMGEAEGVYVFTAREPLTIAIGWPKGFVEEPTAGDRIRDFVLDNLVTAVPVLVFIAMFWTWWTRGRDPKTGTVMAEYEPPLGMTPVELVALTKMSVTGDGLSATIVDLAVRGYLRIVEAEQKILVFSSKSYTIERSKPADDAIPASERAVYDALFEGRESVRVQDLAKDVAFHRKRQAFQAEVVKSLVSAGHFAGNPASVMVAYIAAGIILAVVVGFLAEPIVAWFGTAGVISFFVSSGLVVFFGIFMPRRLPKGAEAYRQAMGFKLYLSMAEKHRIEWQVKENMFEKFLPYAMAFGVVEAWSRAFEGMNLSQPDWYQGASVSAFSPASFGSSLGSFGTASSHATMPSSSGSSGGGSSGGGGGGGGGGSW